MSAEIASDTPTPAAGPCTTDTTGLGSATIALMARFAESSTSPGTPASGPALSEAPMPAPELKPRPAPPIRTTRTLASSAARFSASVMVSNIGAVSELRLSGRLSVSASTPSSSATVRSAIEV